MVDTEFYGYKHWTLEETPRCFYVGKGQASRPHEGGCMRNHKWRAVSERYGLRIEICVGPVSHDEALKWELEWVDREGTFSTNHSHDDPSDIGCNFTRGGSGACGFKHSEETKRRLREKARARGPLPQETREKIRQKLTGRKNGPPTEEHREKLRVALREAHARNPDWTPPVMSEETKTRISASNKGRKFTPEHRQKLSQARSGKVPWNKGKRSSYLNDGTPEDDAETASTTSS